MVTLFCASVQLPNRIMMMLSDSITAVGKLAFCAAANRNKGGYNSPLKPHDFAAESQFHKRSMVSHVRFSNSGL